MQLPLTIDGINERWLSAALSERGPKIEVEAIERCTVIPGTTTKLLLRLRYAGSSAVDAPPTTLCLKGGFDEALRPLVGDAYIAEANFFRELAPALRIEQPRCWFAGADVASRQGIVILDDLAAAGATFGDPTRPWTVDLVAAGLELQADWHARTWGATTERYPLLHPGSWIRLPAEQLFGEANWERAFSDAEHAAKVPRELQSRERIRDAFQSMWQRDDRKGLPCMIHGDPHIGNTFVDAHGKPGFLDWQSGSIAPAMDDVAYFLVGSLSIADRRASERALFEHYLEALETRLGQSLDRDAFWTDYRSHCMHGFIWTVVPPQMQSADCVAAMTERFVAGIIDHDVLSLL